MKVINVPSLILQKLDERGCFILNNTDYDRGRSKDLITIPVSRIALIYKNVIGFANLDGLVPYNFMNDFTSDPNIYGCVFANVYNVEVEPFGNVFAYPGAGCITYNERLFITDTAHQEMVMGLKNSEYNRSMTLSSSINAIPYKQNEAYYKSLSKEEQKEMLEYMKEGGMPLCTTYSPINFLEVVERVNPNSLHSNNNNKQFLKELEDD
jgi:hypothetical protein